MIEAFDKLAQMDQVEHDQALADLLTAEAERREALGALRLMREELDEMAGWWTERMATLAQMTDELLQRAGP